MGEFTASPDPPAGFGGHFAEGGGLHGLGSTAGLGEEEEMEVKGRKEREGPRDPKLLFSNLRGLSKPCYVYATAYIRPYMYIGYICMPDLRTYMRTLTVSYT